MLSQDVRLFFTSGLTLALMSSSCSPGNTTPGDGDAGAGGTGNGANGSGGSPSGGASSSAGGADGSPSGGAPQGSGGSAGGSSSSGGEATTGGGGQNTEGSGGSSSDTCQAPGVLLCDDFETAAAEAAPPAPWTLVMNGPYGTALVDSTTPAHSGSKSVRVDSLGNYQTFFAITGAPVFPASTPALYARVYLRLDEPMTGGHNTYFKAGAAGASSSDNETRLGVMINMLMINQPSGDRGFLSNDNYWNDNLAGVVVEEHTWTCIEGFFDPPHSTVQFWVNEVEVTDLHVTDWKQDTLGAFHFGFESYAGPEATLWYDDIVISTEPIGCD